MKKTLAAAGILIVAAFIGSAAAVAQGKSATRGANPPMTKAVNEMAEESVEPIEQEAAFNSFARADKAASGMRGFKGRSGVHNNGASKLGFCPPGQKKKLQC